MIGDIIKEIRESKNLTQPDLAKILGISDSMMGMIEQNRRKPSDNVKLKICKTFNISMDYLMGLSNTENTQEKDRYIELGKKIVDLINETIKSTDKELIIKL